MKPIFESCMSCSGAHICYYSNFERCIRIEMAANGLGIPCKPKRVESYIKNIPFGLYMALKHIVERSKKLDKNPGMDTDGDRIIYETIDMNKSNEFIDRLARETVMSREDSTHTVSNILRYGNLNDAIKIYDKYGAAGLSNYMFAIQHPAMRKE